MPTACYQNSVSPLLTQRPSVAGSLAAAKLLGYHALAQEGDRAGLRKASESSAYSGLTHVSNIYCDSELCGHCEVGKVNAILGPARALLWAQKRSAH